MDRTFPASPDETHKPLSVLLRELTEREGETILVDEVVDHFGRRAFAALLFIFAVPNLLPLPPGSTTILGLPLVLIAPQLVIGAPNLWLPRAVGRRPLKTRDLKRAFDKLLPRLVRIERWMAPRHGWLFGHVGDRIIGLVCTLLALVLILPIPLGNVLPALSISTLSLGMTQRDGTVVMIGYGLVCASVGALALSAGAVVAGVNRLMHMI